MSEHAVDLILLRVELCQLKTGQRGHVDAYNKHVSIRNGLKVVWSEESHYVLYHVDTRVCLCCLLGEEMAPERTVGD